eukprot:m51a1_g985 hypothetical protein (273) ;mRNA; f:463449-464750
MLCEIPRALAPALRDTVTVWDAAAFHRLTRAQIEQLCGIIDAQGLGAPVTSYATLVNNPDQRLYLYCDGGRVCGILKVGHKRLFIRPPGGTGYVDMNPLCCLDIYVETELQRGGVGRAMYEAFLRREGVEAHRHYGLVSYVPQNNNFVVFDKYFENTSSRVCGDGDHQRASASPQRRGCPGQGQQQQAQQQLSQTLGAQRSPAMSPRYAAARAMTPTLSTPTKPRAASSAEGAAAGLRSPGAWPFGVPDYPVSRTPGGVRSLSAMALSPVRH